MLTVTSKDGTRIAFWRSGEGPPLLLVHGATADHTTTWRYVRSGLDRRFTTYALDRRGRGSSGDGPAYALGREAEDVAAVVEAIGEPVSVLGHSFGALCAIEAARLTGNVRRLILYEGVYLRGADLYEVGLIDRLVAMLEASDVEEMLLTVFREVAAMSDDEIEQLRARQDAWAIRLANAATLPRELRADEAYTFEPGRFADMRAPTLFLVGGNSHPRELANAARIAESLPDARVAILPGQQHGAMYTAPDVFVDEVLRFLAA